LKKQIFTRRNNNVGNDGEIGFSWRIKTSMEEKKDSICIKLAETDEEL
jgi:hypothetical protein